ncbi:TIGR03364 family FAD-dependent oxidoreductase [Chryseobacterium sp. PTM-20240506]|uniref:TIGR03364 family FAD-dependent oxidoreductase n=1 Tax=unclassified Chryseobacterium TaxID=2593645 RepID=UPI002359B674|nr:MULTISPECIES: TIGR03364 family FAD-dependent oxidoreductase [unclassified Chryseobacterium]MDC8105953.1 TIGR03364 family FAD-dependent oxidoreductase [Chryseobacterium sp. B21-037]MDQ1804455.1 TIGR03364 family FAD-dependent oxidoreductase [Chryseobacterium sp. CKR4-1]
MTTKFDLIVVGGGILGTFHAYHALKRNLKVALVEKNAQPQGATVRNFGQVVPSGMDLKWQNFGRESLAIYNELQFQTDLTIRKNGSVYLASNEEELKLINELYDINRKNGYESVLLSKNDCMKKFDGLRSDYCKGGLFFPEELSIDSGEMIVKLHKLLQEKLDLKIYNNTTVIETYEDNNQCVAQTSDGQQLQAAKIIICGGHEFKTLYPNVFNESDLVVTKLQMLQTKAQGIYSLQGNILTGLSIRRYESFQECPSFQEIKALETPDSFEKRYGVHILFKQALDGSIILGDSHEYASAKDSDALGYDLNMEIDEFMISEAKKIIDLPTYEIQRRWFGIYSQCKTKDIFEHNPSPNIHIITGIGGKGMTASGGFSKFNIDKIYA